MEPAYYYNAGAPMRYNAAETLASLPPMTNHAESFLCSPGLLGLDWSIWIIVALALVAIILLVVVIARR